MDQDTQLQSHTVNCQQMTILLFIFPAKQSKSTRENIFVIGLIHTMMARSYAPRMPLRLIQRRKGFCVQIEIIENCLAELYITFTTVVGEGDPELTALNYPL